MFGLRGEWEEHKAADYHRFNMECQLSRSTEEGQNMIAFFERVDNYILDVATANSKAWFGREQTREQLENRYRKLVQHSESGEYDPLLRVKVQLGGKPGSSTEVFAWDPAKEVCLERPDERSEKFTIGNLDTPRLPVRSVIKVSGIWFVSKTFGVSLQATDVMFEQTMRRQPGKSKFTTRGGSAISVKPYVSSGMDVDGAGTEVSEGVINVPIAGEGVAAGIPVDTGEGWA